MKRRTQELLYHLLPVIFWLLAVSGSVLPLVWLPLPTNYLWGFLVIVIVLTCITILGRIKRHESSVEQCFQVAILLGVASYWLPTVLFLMLPIWGYLYYNHIFDLRSSLSTLIGFALVAIWASVFIYMGWIANPWADFFAKENAWGWIPTGAILTAWLASTIAHKILRVR